MAICDVYDLTTNPRVLRYPGLRYGSQASINSAYYGSPSGDAISAFLPTSRDLYSAQHVVRLEWVAGSAGYLRWFLDDEFFFEIPAESLEQDLPELSPRMLPEEPMYLILNTAMSPTWSTVCHETDVWKAGAEQRCPPGSEHDPKGCCKIFPASLEVDWIRVYQDDKVTRDDVYAREHPLSCSTPKYPTEEYITLNQNLYGGLLAYVPPPETPPQGI